MKKQFFTKSGFISITLLAALQAAAVQGGLDYEHASGFYAGGWGSNVDFGDGTSYELDLYAGFSGSVEELGYDVGYI